MRSVRGLSAASVAAFALAALAAARSAAAEEPQRWEDTRGGASLIGRPHTVAELQAGVIALPTAPISKSFRGGQTPFGTFGKGDATFQTGIHLLYRASRTLAFGAGAMFTPIPTTDDNYQSPSGGMSQVSRAHSRSYLFLGGGLPYFL